MAKSRAWEQQRRQRRFVQAASAAVDAGVPLTVAITLTWHRLMQNGERRDGNCLALAENERVMKIWNAVWRLLKRNRVPFIAARAPEYDATKGPHLHLPAHIPDDLLKKVVAVIERLTGAPAEIYRAPDSAEFKRPYRTQGRVVHGVVAVSACGGWMVQKNLRPLTGGTTDIMRYTSKSARRPDAPQYRLSHELAALARQAHGSIAEQAGRAVRNIAPQNACERRVG